MALHKITITKEDYEQLSLLLNSETVQFISGSEQLNELKKELDRAHVVSPNDVSDDVITMNSTFTVRDLDSGEAETYTLVYPERADIANQKLSVLAPIGTAVLGYRVGDQLRWPVPAGMRRLNVEQVLSQPEREEVLPL